MAGLQIALTNAVVDGVPDPRTQLVLNLSVSVVTFPYVLSRDRHRCVWLAVDNFGNNRCPRCQSAARSVVRRVISKTLMFPSDFSHT
jgi:hypothetical protein